ncbi:hypothetical protein FF1_006068 [Malus domestica]
MPTGGSSLLRNSQIEHYIAHERLELLNPCVVRHLHPRREAATVGADLEHSLVLKRNKHILVGECQHSCREDVGVSGLSLVESGVYGRKQIEFSEDVGSFEY